MHAITARVCMIIIYYSSTLTLDHTYYLCAMCIRDRIYSSLLFVLFGAVICPGIKVKPRFTAEFGGTETAAVNRGFRYTGAGFPAYIVHVKRYFGRDIWPR